MASPIDYFKQRLSTGVNKLSDAINQYPGLKFGANVYKNFMKNEVSPQGIVGTAVRAIPAVQNINALSKLATLIPQYKQYTPEPIQQKVSQIQRNLTTTPQDIFNAAKVYGAVKSPVTAPIGGALQVLGQGISNRMDNKPFLDNAAKSFAEGMSSGLAYGGISAANPYLDKIKALTPVAKYAGRSLLEGTENAIGSLLEPLQPGQDRFKKAGQDFLFGAAMAPLMQGGEDVSRGLSKLFGKKVAEPIMNEVNKAKNAVGSNQFVIKSKQVASEALNKANQVIDDRFSQITKLNQAKEHYTSIGRMDIVEKIDNSLALLRKQIAEEKPYLDSVGAFYGFETYQDEDGKTKFRYNPEKGFIGVAGTFGGRKALKYADQTKFSSLLDKKPRFEIDDSGAKIKASDSLRMPYGSSLEEILDHPELFKNYPEMRDIPVRVSKSMSENGGYDPIKNEIIVSDRFIKQDSGNKKYNDLLEKYNEAKKLFDKNSDNANEYISKNNIKEGSPEYIKIEKVLDEKWNKMQSLSKEMKEFASLDYVDKLSNEGKSTLLHEIQHAIQQIEGFARGGSPSNISEKYLKKTFSDANMLVRSGFTEMPSGSKTWSLDKAIKTAEKAGIKPSQDSIDIAIKKSSEGIKGADDLLRIIKSSPKDKFEAYKRLSGELEARSVQRRIDMPMAERLKTDPYAAEAMATTGMTNPKDFITPIKQIKETPILTTQVSKQQENILPGQQGITSLKTSPISSPVQQTIQTVKSGAGKVQKSLEPIISEAKKQIGGIEETPKVGVKKQVKKALDDFYTQWVDRFNPIVQASRAAKKVGSLATKDDPEYLVRRLTGAGGIADATFRRELNPVLKEMESMNIDTGDMDVFLKAKRDLGLAERGIKGSDAKKAQEVIGAIEQKYGINVNKIADQLYQYQDKHFQELVDAGFISAENAKIIREQNPNYVPFERVMDTEISDYLGIPTRKTMQGTNVVNKIKGSERKIYSPIESIIANTFKHRAAIEKNRVAKSIVGLQNIADLGFEKVAKSGSDTISVWNNGKKEFWRVGQDIADVAKGSNEENMNMVLKLIQKPASILRQGATGRNPEFMLPNVIKDQLDAAVTSKYGYIPFVDYVSGLYSMVKDDSVFREWEKSGAKIDLGELSGRKSIHEAVSGATQKKRLRDFLGASLDFLGKYSEQPTRVGLFKKAYKKTGDPLIAAMESRDATVDFARMGTKMKVANSIIPFLNVGIQGFDKIARSLKNNPGKFLLNATIYGSTPAVATTLYNLINYPKEYAEVPQYEKDSNFILVTGKNQDGTVNYKKFPKGNVIPLISNPVQSAIEYAYGNNKETFAQAAMGFFSSALPVIGEGTSAKEIAVKTIGSNLPQAIKPITENLINKSFYKYNTKTNETKEIVPYYLKKKQPYEQAYDFTPQMYKKIGAALNVSPLQVQNLMEGYLAGYTKIPSQIIDAAYKLSRGEKVRPNDITLLRRFSAQTYKTNPPSTPEYKPPTPSLMERLTGKAKAAEETSIKSPEQLKYEIDQAREQVKMDNKIQRVDSYIIYKDGDSVKTMNTKDFAQVADMPKYTNDELLNKELYTDYSNTITRLKNQSMKMYQLGLINESQIKQALKMLEGFRDQAKRTNPKATTKKGKKVSPIKISIPKISPIKVRKPRSARGVTKRKLTRVSIKGKSSKV